MTSEGVTDTLKTAEDVVKQCAAKSADHEKVGSNSKNLIDRCSHSSHKSLRPAERVVSAYRERPEFWVQTWNMNPWKADGGEAAGWMITPKKKRVCNQSVIWRITFISFSPTYVSSSTLLLLLLLLFAPCTRFHQVPVLWMGAARWNTVSAVVYPCEIDILGVAGFGQ